MEIKDLDRSDLCSLTSHCTTLLEHMLKLKNWETGEPLARPSQES